jgi:hypothetical protein
MAVQREKARLSVTVLDNREFDVRIEIQSISYKSGPLVDVKRIRESFRERHNLAR